ncbi:craniofacial development protein 2-like [Lineus longissimus]|uniref:craniofacial development protein 2-like n=1 Tax=Lineus longissimus TaxID=88925 RepID=UPI00315D6CA0
MKDGGQSQPETSSPTADLLSPKHINRIGSWNVRTLFQTGKPVQTIREMKNYKLSLLGIQEARWVGSGKRQLATGDTIIWSGRNDHVHQGGVALAMTKEATRALLEWKPVSERLLYARLNSRYVKLSVLVNYAPTEVADDADKDDFYDGLQSTIDRIPNHDVLLLLGDFNARLGSDNAGRESNMGKHGMGTMNDNGSRLSDLCGANRLTVGGTLFEHKRIHKLTWRSPDGKTHSQIDHIVINNKWKRSLQDVRVKRLADVGSDHHLLVAKLSLKLKKASNGSTRKNHFDIDKLQDPEIKRTFNITLRNRFQQLQDEQEMSIHAFNEAMQETGKQILGFRKTKKEEWISAASWTKIDERKAIKKNLLSTKSPRLQERRKAEYSQKDKEVKKSCRKDKRQYFDNLATDAENAARRKDMATLYKATKKMRGNTGPSQDTPVKDKNGSHISGEKEKTERWREHFAEILNSPHQQNQL